MGLEMTMERAIAFAEDVPGSSASSAEGGRPDAHPAAWQLADRKRAVRRLRKRQAEVLRLVAAGRPTARLQASWCSARRRLVDTWKNIFALLGVSSRAAAPPSLLFARPSRETSDVAARDEVPAEAVWRTIYRQLPITTRRSPTRTRPAVACTASLAPALSPALQGTKRGDTNASAVGDGACRPALSRSFSEKWLSRISRLSCLTCRR